MMKNILLIFFLLFSLTSISQDNLSLFEMNNYKYVIVPQKFDFLKEPNQYQVNALTKFLFDKYGYDTYSEGEDLPTDYAQNKCLGLKVDVVKIKQGFLSHNLQIHLINCKDQIIVSSPVGKSREKEYEKAYNLALREAFKVFQYFDHTYVPNNEVMIAMTGKQTSNDSMAEVVIEQEAKIQSLKEEVEALKQNSGAPNSEAKLVNEPKVQLNKPTKEEVQPVKVLEKGFYAKQISNGFQIEDETQKKIMIILETPKREVYLVKDQNAIVYKENGFWYLSKNDGDNISVEKIKLKF